MKGENDQSSAGDSQERRDGGLKFEVGPEDPELAAATQIYSPEEGKSCLKGGLSGTPWLPGWTGRYDGCLNQSPEDKKRKNRQKQCLKRC